MMKFSSTASLKHWISNVTNRCALRLHLVFSISAWCIIPWHLARCVASNARLLARCVASHARMLARCAASSGRTHSKIRSQMKELKDTKIPITPTMAPKDTRWQAEIQCKMKGLKDIFPTRQILEESNTNHTHDGIQRYGAR